MWWMLDSIILIPDVLCRSKCIRKDGTECSQYTRWPLDNRK